MNTINTWEDARAFMLNRYQIQEDNDSYLTLIFGWDNDRSQMVVVSCTASKSGVPWIEMKSPVGVIPTAALPGALDSLGDAVCGGLVKAGDRYWVRHSMPIGDASPDEFEFPLQNVAYSADQLERRILGGDVQ